MNVGERTNVTGSAKFRKLIVAGDYAAALDVARQQVASGAQIIDVNMDEGMLDSEAAMVRFLNLIAAEPDIARVPVMIDSSKWAVIEAGLKCVQGKADRQLDQHEGRRGRVHRSTRARCGATARPWSSWRSTRRARPTRSSARSRSASAAYKILTEQVGFPPEDIIFDPNIFAIATGIEEHNNYGIDFIEATREIKRKLPHAHGQRRRQQRVVLVPRQRPGARGDPRRVPVSRDQRRAWTWAS